MSTAEYIQPDNKIQTKITHDDVIEDFSYEKSKQLLSFEDAPEYLKHNTFIITGYRGVLNTKLCMER